MRNAALVVVAIALLAGPIRPQGAAQAPAQAWADKLFLADGGSTSHDFGNVPHGAQLHYRFPLTNIYAVPLQIVEARASCGCATVTLSTKVLKPREKGYLDVTMDGHRFAGPKSIYIYVTVGPEFTSTATLQVTANARRDIVFNPGQVSFGVVAQGQTPSQTIDVEYAGVLEWKVLEVLTNSGPVTATFEELYRKPGQAGQAGQVGYRIKVTLKADAPAGPLKHELVLKTNDPASLLVPVLVEANVQAALTLAPGKMVFGSVKVGESATRRIQVRGNKEFRVLSVAGLGDDVTVDLPTTAAALQTITFKYQPRKSGELRRSLTLKTELGDVTVPAEGNATP